MIFFTWFLLGFPGAFELAARKVLLLSRVVFHGCIDSDPTAIAAQNAVACHDDHEPSTHAQRPTSVIMKPNFGTDRVHRGCSWSFGNVPLSMSPCQRCSRPCKRFTRLGR